jgi:cell filamentation protein
MPENGEPLTAEKRHELETLFTAWRIGELRLDPVRGRFDAAHLREINRRIFQDLPGLGFTNVTPGKFRPAVPPGNDWIKSRRLDVATVTSYVAYSAMDLAAQARLDQVLKGADPTELRKLKTAGFTQAIGKLYAEIDYIHPFSDGNSRTLREFTRELAEASGYTLDWTQFSRSPAGRDILYIARDLSVNALALPHIKQFGTKRDVVLCMDQLGGNRDLPDLLRDAIRPSRAIAFEQLPETEAIAQHTDLAGAFRTMRSAAQYFETKIPGDATARRNALLAVRKHVQTQLDHGETRDFQRSPTGDKQKSQNDPERGLDHETRKIVR